MRFEIEENSSCVVSYEEDNDFVHILLDSISVVSFVAGKLILCRIEPWDVKKLEKKGVMIDKIPGSLDTVSGRIAVAHED